jgi:hypothetical protein
MRVVLIGSPLRRQQLRAQLPGNIDVVAKRRRSGRPARPITTRRRM